MKKALKLISTTALTTFAVTNASHPFVGEHANATSIEREDGGVTMKMTHQEASSSMNKYSTLIDRTKTSGPEMTISEMLVEHVFGKSEEKEAFE